MAPKRIHLDAAARKKAYRDKHQILMEQLGELKEALTLACENGRSAALVNHLPDHPREWVQELTARLRNRKVVTFKREE